MGTSLSWLLALLGLSRTLWPASGLASRRLEGVGASAQGCGLGGIRNRLHLFVMTPTTDSLLMSHFFEHYANLDVDMGKVHVLLHVIDNATFSDMRALLERVGVQSYSNISKYHSDLKREGVNSWLKSLPPDAWAIYADSDEFFEFPCNTTDWIQKGEELFWGSMADAVGPKITFPELQASPAIEVQFPMTCPGLRKACGGTDHKYTLFKVYHGSKVRQFKNSHEVVVNKTSLAAAGGEIERVDLDDSGNVMFLDPIKTPTEGKYIGSFPHYQFTGRGYFTKLRYKMNKYSNGLDWDWLDKLINHRKAMYNEYAALFDMKAKMDEKDSKMEENRMAIPPLSKKGRTVLKSTCSASRSS